LGLDGVEIRAGALTVALLAAGCGTGQEEAGRLMADKTDDKRFTRSDFETAKHECSEVTARGTRIDSEHVRVLDGGTALAVSTEGDSSPGVSYVTMLCIFDALEVPEAVVSRIARTRALDGTQGAEWDAVSASWTYHPGSGLDILF
jgi:hypothetical protein